MPLSDVMHAGQTPDPPTHPNLYGSRLMGLPPRPVTPYQLRPAPVNFELGPTPGHW